MSKIQKALDSMKDVRTREGRSDVQSSRLPSSTRHTDEPTLVTPELDVVEQLAIDTAGLAEKGLLIEDDEGRRLVAQQFRRAKRPVLKCAFDLGLPVGDSANVVMVASALPGSGKSFCSFNLAASIGLERDVGAVLVDADVLKPGLSEAFGVSDRIGLVDYLANPDLSVSDILIQTDVNGLIFVPSGQLHSNATELLASNRMKKFVSEMADQFQKRVVIFDTPPLLVTSEAQVLAAHMGQIVFVIEARVSSQDSVKQALSMLDSDKPINAILNKSRSAETASYQSGDYGYYSASKGEE